MLVDDTEISILDLINLGRLCVERPEPMMLVENQASRVDSAFPMVNL